MSKPRQNVISFKRIHKRASKRKGGPEALEALLPKAKSPRSLARIPDDRWLAACTKAVFSAGFVWAVVDNKWDGFEAAFDAFDVERVATRSDKFLEKLAHDERIIRNRTKIWSVRDNARYFLDCAETYGSFAKMVAKWPVTDLVGLYDELKRGGSRLGGTSAGYFMRAMGKDTYILTPSVIKALEVDKVVDRAPTSKKAKAAVQAAFNHWHDETGRPMCQLSRILACSVP